MHRRQAYQQCQLALEPLSMLSSDYGSQNWYDEHWQRKMLPGGVKPLNGGAHFSAIVEGGECDVKERWRKGSSRQQNTHSASAAVT